LCGPLKGVLAKKDKAADNPNLATLLEDDEKLADRIARARERAMVQLELVAPVSDPDLLHDIARARNLSQSVDQTALQNLAGKYELMKQVLRDAPQPFGPSFVERVVWKTNQEVPEGSAEVPVKTLIHLLALMNTRLYKPGVKGCALAHCDADAGACDVGAAGRDLALLDQLVLGPCRYHISRKGKFSDLSAGFHLRTIRPRFDTKPRPGTALVPFRGIDRAGRKNLSVRPCCCILGIPYPLASLPPAFPHLPRARHPAASCQSARIRSIVPGDRRTGSRARTRTRLR
jgi:hypothetical protein